MKVVSEIKYRGHIIEVTKLSVGVYTSCFKKSPGKIVSSMDIICSCLGTYRKLDDCIKYSKIDIDAWIKKKIKERQQYLMKIHEDDDTIEIIAQRSGKSIYRGESISDANNAIRNYLIESEKYIIKAYSLS